MQRLDTEFFTDSDKVKASGSKEASTMKDWIIQLICSFAVLAGIAVAYHFGPQRVTRGPPWVPHVVTLAVLLVIALAVPIDYAKYVFSPLTAVFAGTVFPIYESVRAVCTPAEEDDKAWLQYWMVCGVLFMCTGWVAHVMDDDSVVYWYEVSTTFFVWLFYPLTDGAHLLYNNVTAPYIAPKVKPLAAKMTNMISALYHTLINAMHLWFLWIIFMVLPAGLKRIIAVAIGTFYPLISSIAAASTEEVADDTYWLTYWSVYGCLFLIMELLETWLGWIPGFYTLVILATVYLMLPMFQGADKLFRKVLVPLAGLQELLLLRDAIQVKKQMLLDLDPARSRAVRHAIAQFYADEEATTMDPAEVPGAMKKEYLSEWIKLPGNPFASSTTDATSGESTESTPLV